jgi:hypothetical protein
MNQGGKKDLSNWTGGHPVLLLSLLNSLVGVGGRGLTNDDVNGAAGVVASELADFLDKLWNAWGVACALSAF